MTPHQARILELKRRYFENYCSNNQCVVSIKEDTAYLCLHSPNTTKEQDPIHRIQKKAIRRIQKKAIRRIQAIWEENILEDIKRGPYSKKPPICRLRKKSRLSLKNDMSPQDKFPPSNNQTQKRLLNIEIRKPSSWKSHIVNKDCEVLKLFKGKGICGDSDQPKGTKNAAWFTEKVDVAEAQDAGQILEERELAFFDSTPYDSDCDDLSSAKVVLMENLSSCDLEVLSECLKLEAELVKKNDVYNKLSKWFSHLEQHCISFEVAMQLNKEIFQKDKSIVNQYDPEIQEYFEQNDLKVQLQAKDTVISKLKETIHYLRENANPEKVKKNIDETETIKIEMEHISKPNATTIAPRMYKLDIEPISHRLKNNRDAHEDYLNKTIKNTNIILGLVERARKQNPSEPLLDSACMFTKHVQELFADPITSSSNTQSQVVQIVMWYLDYGCSKHMTGNRSQLTNLVNKFLGTVKFGNNQIAKIMGYSYYQIGNVTISRVYYVERLGHNLFSVGQFCDSDLKVAFRKHTCFVRNLEGVDLLSGSRGTNF
ncbi:hypothetical protein Tco_0813603 [Tanacetum coccineum]